MLVPDETVPDAPYATACCWNTTMRNDRLSITNKRVVQPNEDVREALHQVAMLHCKVSSFGLEMEKLRLRITDLSEELGQAKLRAEVSEEVVQPQQGQRSRSQELGPCGSALRADMAMVQAELRESIPEGGQQPCQLCWRPSSERKLDMGNLRQVLLEMDELRVRHNSAVDLTNRRARRAPHDEWRAQHGGQILRDMEALGGEELQAALDELAQSHGRLLEHVASQANRVHRVESKLAALNEKVETRMKASERVHMLVDMPEAYKKRSRPMFDCGGPRVK